MKIYLTLLSVLLMVCISGCDAWFSRRIDVSSAESRVTLPKNADSAAVLESIREYAKMEHIPCRDSGQLPIECWLQPIRIWAISDGQKVVVCYDAMGIPLERGKFERRMDRLEKLLRERVGNAATVVQAQCPKPPMFLSNSDLKTQ